MGESLLEVKTRIQTVESIRKITNAMKLIANSRYNQLKNLYDGNLAYMEEIKEAMELCLLYVDYSKTAQPTCLVQNPGNKKLYIPNFLFLYIDIFLVDLSRSDPKREKSSISW